MKESIDGWSLLRIHIKTACDQIKNESELILSRQDLGLSEMLKHLLSHFLVGLRLTSKPWWVVQISLVVLNLFRDSLESELL